MKIADIRVGDRARHEPGEIASLVRSIEQVGLLHPVVVTRNNELVSGFRRIEAYKQLGRDEIPHTVAENLDDALKLLKAERDENTERKQLTRSEAVALAKKLRPLERTEAEERQRASLMASRGGTSREAGLNPIESGGGKLPPREKGKSRDKVAAAVGMSERSLKKADEVVEAALADPEKFGPLVKEMDATRKVDPAFKKLKQIRANETGDAAPTDGRIRSFYTELMSTQSVIRRIRDEGGPDRILITASPEERHHLVKELREIIEVLEGWAQILEMQGSETASLTGDSEASTEPDRTPQGTQKVPPESLQDSAPPNEVPADVDRTDAPPAKRKQSASRASMKSGAKKATKKASRR